MSNYTKTTNFASKDNLSPGNPLKIVKGTEIDTEFNNIQTAVATKTDNSAANITGGSITGITDLAVADGGTGASTATAALNNLLPTQTGNANKYLQTDGTNATWDAVSLSTADITGTLPVANGGTGVTSSTGTGSVVLSNSPTLVTPALGTPASGTATNLTGLPISTGVSGLGTGVATFLGTPSSANLASAVSDETGSGALVFANSPTLVTPALGTPASATLTNATGLPISTGVSGLGTGVATFLATPSSANLASAVSDETGSGALVFANSPTLVTPALGTPSALVGTNITGTASGLTAGNVTTNANLTGAITSTGNATSLGSFSSANLLGALTDETGTGSAVFATSPTLVTPILGTPTSATLTNATGLPISTGVSGLGTGVATALAVNVGSAGAPVVNGGALGTPSSGTVTNLTGTASININGTVGATTASTGAFTTLTTSSTVTHNGGTANGVTYLNGSKVLTSGSALTFDGTNLSVGNSGLTGDRNVKVINSTGNSTFGTYGGSGYGSLTSGDAYAYTSKNIVLMADDAAASIKFSAGGSAEGMRLTSTGLGIGTSSPAYKLDLYTTAQFSGRWGNATRAGHFYADSGGVGIFDTAAYGGEGMYFHAGSNYIQFITNSNENMRLDSAGNLGIGTTSPSAKLDVAGSAYVRGDSTDATFTSAGQLAIKRSSSDPVLSFHANAGSQIGNIQMQASGTCSITVAVAQPLAFNVNGSERARIDSSGNLLVGTTSQINDGKQTISFGGGSHNGLVLSEASNTSNTTFLAFSNGSSIIGAVSRVGSTAAVVYSTTSDYRLKTVTGAVTGQGSRIDALKPVDYQWKESNTSARGFLAHEFQAVYPNSVSGTKDAVDADGNPKYQAMQASNSEVIADLVAEIQSLRQRLSAANL